MRLILYILFLTLTNFCYSFKDTLKYNLSNQFSYVYSKSHNLNFQGENVFRVKKCTLQVNTTYSYAITKSVIEQNELLNKNNFIYKNFFFTHIFNSSYNRQIKFDNSFGVGYVYKSKKSFSLSYASIVQFREYYNLPSIEKIRHSIRFKFKYPHKVINLIYECYYQPNMVDFKDYIIFNNIKVILFENKKINFALSDNINYQSKQTVKVVHSFNLGINFNLNKN